MDLDEEIKCKECPNARHGFDRNASHNSGRYVCECESFVCPSEQLRQRVAELENERLEQQEKLCGCIVNLGQLRAERDKAHQYWQIAEGRCDALKQQRDELLAAIKKFLDENNPEGFGCACEPDRLCGPCSEAKRQRPLYAAIASVKEK